MNRTDRRAGADPFIWLVLILLACLAVAVAGVLERTSPNEPLQPVAARPAY